MSTCRHTQELCIHQARHCINIFMMHTRAVWLQSPQQCQTRHRWYHQRPTSQGLCCGSHMPSPYQLARPTVQPMVASPWLITHPLTVLTTHIHIHACITVHRCEHVLDVQPCCNTTHIQSLKKPSQCFAILERVTWNKSNKLSDIVKIMYVILHHLGFRKYFGSCDLDQKWCNNKRNKMPYHWDSFLTLTVFWPSIIFTIYPFYWPESL